MSKINPIQQILREKGWLDAKTDTGAPAITALFDGQFGSTGKGLLSAWLGKHIEYECIMTTSGPNSGHTAYIGDKKVVTKHIPISAIQSMYEMLNGKRDTVPYVELGAGAIIDPDILTSEYHDHFLEYGDLAPFVSVNPLAAWVKPEHRGDDGDHKGAHIASTGTGVGPALIDKIKRKPDAIMKQWFKENPERSDFCVHDCWDFWRNLPNLLEIAQGWSLGINMGFYPHVTARNCSIAQGISDMGFSPRHLQKSIVSLRTFPIRVGNTEKGNSGGIWQDQEEISFEELDVEPEYTTVTGRMRRIFTWSDLQFHFMLESERPDALFVNFVNYLKPDEIAPFMANIIKQYDRVMKRKPDFVLIGTGPKTEDVKLWEI